MPGAAPKKPKGKKMVSCQGQKTNKQNTYTREELTNQ